jgi:hypothetical protein
MILLTLTEWGIQKSFHTNKNWTTATIDFDVALDAFGTGYFEILNLPVNSVAMTYCNCTRIPVSFQQMASI